MATIKVGFSRPRGFSMGSLLIRIADRAPYSHTYIRFYSSRYDRWLVYQASPAVVSFYGMSEFVKSSEILREFDIDVSEETRSRMITYAIDTSGMPYDMRSVAGIAIVKVAALLGKRIVSPFGDGRGMFCSELVGSVLKEIVGERISGDISTMTPKDIYMHLESREA